VYQNIFEFIIVMNVKKRLLFLLLF